MLKGAHWAPSCILKRQPQATRNSKEKNVIWQKEVQQDFGLDTCLCYSFFPFGTSHTFCDVKPWVCMLYAHTWYFWIQHNSIFQSSHDMCLYDNLWPSNYKVTENNLKIYSFLASPPILGMCFKVSIHYIHQDIHFNLLPRGKVTS